MGTRVFIIDDNAAARNMLKNMLSADGSLEVVGEAETGQVGIIMLEESSPDIVLLEADVSGGMPLGEVVTELKRVKPDLRIILCTQPLNTDLVIPMSALGVVDFINKPYNRHEVQNTVRAVASGA
jgi:DNA-binding NarL/FixJ family response regulator